ncbi:MAG: tRNA 4-thiouridine(8) synthase ThiI [Lachnospiraceae bacterium]|nr:tRNA 4-thiouridine(8) synthase ThiI [Lachnospiraceae bacterium]
MFSAFLIKYGEIGIKGRNRHIFEDALMDSIRFSLSKVPGDFDVTKEQGRIYVKYSSDFDYDSSVAALKKVFGITSFCPVVISEDKSWDVITKASGDYIEEVYPDRNFSFKAFARRADKKYPKHSMEIAAEIGEYLLKRFPELSVDVHHPDVSFNIEIRECAYIYSIEIPGPGGMPIGTNGTATLLLSGGIDSPVAGYMIARRGVNINAVYFDAPPYTSERARQKVLDLAKIISAWCGPIELHIINFTDIQLAIFEHCPHDELTIIMRRYMMRIAEKIAWDEHRMGLITGESIGQVASQTMQSLRATNAVCHIPVYRPLIGFDKNDIIEIAEKIGTFETSILPYEDCCTIFVDRHPVTKPNVHGIEKSEHHLKGIIEDLVEEALRTQKVVVCE